MRDIALSLPRELVAILEPLLAYRVGDYSLRTSYKSNSSTLSISFDLGQRKRPLVKAPAKTKPKERKTPAPTPAAPRPVQKVRPPKIKKAPPIAPMEIQESLPSTPPPPVAAMDLAPLESRGEEPFRSPEGTGHGRKKRKRRDISSPESSPRPATTATTECQTTDPTPPSLADSFAQTDIPELPDFNSSHTQTTMVEEPTAGRSFQQRALEKAASVLKYYDEHEEIQTFILTKDEQVHATDRSPIVIHQVIDEEEFDHDIHTMSDLSEFFLDADFKTNRHLIGRSAAILVNSLYKPATPTTQEEKLTMRLLQGHRR